MAGYYRYTAVLDACVLYPAPLRDLLLSLASDGFFGARWTLEIQDEWIRNLAANRTDLTREALARTADLMNNAIEDCLIENYEFMIGALTLPDANDRHVLAAAIVGHADDDFVVAQYDLDPIRFLRIIKTHRNRLKNPPKSAEDFIKTYELQGLVQTCKLLRAATELI